jgi:ABC-type phosphate transport system substrate-binding protein
VCLCSAATRVLAAVAVLPLLWTSVPASSVPLALVLNRENPVTSLGVPEVQRIFRKQTRMWPHGEAVVPVDWDATSDARQEFSRRVLNRSVREMADFWVQQNITQGLTPPSTLKSARAILRFVASVPGSIGYVAVADVDQTVKVIEIKGLR